MLCDRIEIYLNSGFTVGAWLEDGKIRIWKDIEIPCKWHIMRDIAEDLETSVNELIINKNYILKTEDDLIEFIRKEGYYETKMAGGHEISLLGHRIFIRD